MNRGEVKTAINEMLKNFPEPVLNEVLEYLKSVEGKSTESVVFSHNLKRILIEDNELLARLA